MLGLVVLHQEQISSHCIVKGVQDLASKAPLGIIPRTSWIVYQWMPWERWGHGRTRKKQTKQFCSGNRCTNHAETTTDWGWRTKVRLRRREEGNLLFNVITVLQHINGAKCSRLQCVENTGFRRDTRAAQKHSAYIEGPNNRKMPNRSQWLGLMQCHKQSLIVE